ncbi:MAG: hypothetical protein KC609_25885 [Myxococcales bacterium]|nr:hypothetical protein [Myxococcales bacterium]
MAVRGAGSITISSRWLIVCGAAISLAGLAAEIGYAVVGETPLSLRVVRFLSLSAEGNLPTWYASSLLLVAALLLVAIARSARRDATETAHWWVLALGFFYISLDEAVEIHEGWSDYISSSGIAYFGWVIPAAVIVVLVALAYVPFLRRLPRWARLGFLVSGAIYVGGALLMELPLGAWTELHGTDNLTYALLDWVEETLELVGVSLFLIYLERYRDQGLSDGA